MFVSIYAQKGKTIGARCYADAQWWTGAAWSSNPASAAVTTLTELSIAGNAYENLFHGTLTPPTGVYQVECLDTSTGLVIGVDDSRLINITDIKAKTDNLPASPAAVSDIPTANITAIKAKTDNLPASPAATGAAMALTSDERIAMTAAVWATRQPGDYPTAITYTGTLINTVTWFSGKVCTYHYNGANLLTGITEA